MKKILVLLTIISIFITSCSKNDYSLYRPSDINVTIQGTVYDNEGRSPLSGVTVSLSFDGKTLTTVTDTNGIYTLKNLNSGVYNLKFKHIGYGTILTTVNANPIDYTGNHYIANFNTSLHKMDQVLSTRIVIPVTPSESYTIEYLPAANMPVTIYLDSTYVNNKIIDTTDANGFINVQNLPKDLVRLVINSKIGNYHFYSGSAPDYSIVQYPFDFESRYILTQENIAYFYLVTTNIIDASNGNAINTFVNKNSIKFQFSGAVDLTYPSMSINMYKIVNSSSEEVAKAVTWSGTTCTVDPLGTTLDSSAQYEININLKSVSGYYYNSTFDFKIQSPGYTLAKVASLQLLDPPTVDSTIYIVDCNISTVANADKYEAYGQYGKADEFLYMGTYSPGSNTDPTFDFQINLAALSWITVPTNGIFSNGAVFKIIVRAVRNDGTTGPFSSALSLHN